MSRSLTCRRPCRGRSDPYPDDPAASDAKGKRPTDRIDTAVARLKKAVVEIHGDLDDKGREAVVRPGALRRSGRSNPSTAPHSASPRAAQRPRHGNQEPLDELADPGVSRFMS